MFLISGTTTVFWRRDPVEELRVVCACQRGRALTASRVAGFALLSIIVLTAMVSTPLGADFLDSASGALMFPGAQIEIVELEAGVHQPVLPTTHPFFDPETTTSSVRSAFFHGSIPYGSIILEEAERNGLRPELVAAVVKTESDFRPTLISHANALGLMQILPSTGRFMGGGDLFNPADNIRTGARYLRYLHQRFDGDETLFLAAYNAGEGNVLRYQGVPPFEETQNYVRKVAHSHDRYETLIRRSVNRWNRVALRLKL